MTRGESELLTDIGDFAPLYRHADLLLSHSADSQERMVGTVNRSSFQACRAGAAGHVISEETFLKLFHQGRPNQYRGQDDLKIISFDISI